MQPLPALPLNGQITISSSNKAQQRGTHGAYRYFGKLAPDVTSHVLDLANGYVTTKRSAMVVVDLMCGSGTTLLEATERQWSAVGVDVNPVACLYARTKLRAIDKGRALNFLEEAQSDLRASDSEISEVFAATRSAERWFNGEARSTVAALRRNIDRLPASPERDLLKATLLSRLRRISNASQRTGRIFYDPASAVPPLRDFVDGVESVVEKAPEEDRDAEVLERDGRSSGLPDAIADIVFLHPPYFALYRYSSDVLRFEMEVGGYSRRSTAQQEIREGWKSGDASNLQGYLTDMQAILAESRRVLKPGGVVALTASNSTLGDAEMPVIDGIAAGAQLEGLAIRSHLERTAHHGSASYHRSARRDKVIQQDHVLIMTPA